MFSCSGASAVLLIAATWASCAPPTNGRPPIWPRPPSSRRANERDRRADHDDRQRGGRAGGRVRRRHLRRLVSHHAIHQRHRRAERLSGTTSPRPGDGRGDLRRGAGRGRIIGHRHGHRRGLCRRAGHDGHQRPWHLAHGSNSSGWATLPKCRRSSGISSASAPAPACRPAPARATSLYLLFGPRRHEERHPAALFLARECFDFGYMAFDRPIRSKRRSSCSAIWTWA